VEAHALDPPVAGDGDVSDVFRTGSGVATTLSRRQAEALGKRSWSVPHDRRAGSRAEHHAWHVAQRNLQVATRLRSDLDLHAARQAAEAASLALHQIDPARWDQSAVECLLLVGDLRFRTGDAGTAVEVLLEAEELVADTHRSPPIDPSIVHRLHARLSSVYNCLGLYAFALTEAYASLSVADAQADVAAQSRAWGDIAQVHLSVNDPVGAARAADRAVTTGRDARDAPTLAVALALAALARSRQGQFEVASAHLVEPATFDSRLAPTERVAVLLARAELATRTDELDEADAALLAARELLRPGNDSLAWFGILTSQAANALVRGDADRTRAHVEEALGLDDPTVALVVRCERMMAQALELLGDLAGALRWEQQAHRTHRRLLAASTQEQVRVVELEYRAKRAERRSDDDRVRADLAEAETRVTAAQYEAVLQESSDIVAVLNDDHTVRWVSDSSQRILGIDGWDMLRATPGSLMHPDDTGVLDWALGQARLHPGVPVGPAEFRVRHRDGTWRNLTTLITDLRHVPGIAGILLAASDTTRNRWNEGLIASHAKALDLIARFAPLEAVLHELVASLEALSAPSLRCGVRWGGPSEPGDELSGPHDRSYSLEDTDGRTVGRLVVSGPLAAFTDEGEQVIAQTVQLARIAVERSTAADLLAYQATHDRLTGLPNRLRFEQLTAAAIGNGGAADGYVAVMYLDLDRFKLVNDSCGHPVGDHVLIEATRRIQSCLAPGEIAARIGGDEFLVLMPAVTDLAEVLDRTERLRTAVSAPYAVGAGEVELTVSIGITTGPAATSDAHTLISEADSAMSRAKEAGRDRSELFDSGMRIASENRLAWGTALRRALPRQELRLEYQPVVDLRTGRIAGHEALLRWDSVDLGLVGPAEFIPLAEESGLMVPIGAWVIGTALEALAHQPFPLPMWINLSTHQLTHPSLLPTVTDALHDLRIDPALVCFEITESALGSDPGGAIDTVTALHALGARIAIDDFGTGYSSLDRLQALPVQVLKVDWAFVSGVERSPRRQVLLKAILELSRSLGMEAVAEGIETAAELDCVMQAGCPLAQGFLLARPGPAPRPAGPLDLAPLLATLLPGPTEDPHLVVGGPRPD